MPTLIPKPDNGILDHLDVVVKIIGPILGITLGLIIWAWKKMEESVKEAKDFIIAHIKQDDKIHDELFTRQRETDHKLDELVGEHRARHEDE